MGSTAILMIVWEKFMSDSKEKLRVSESGKVKNFIIMHIIGPRLYWGGFLAVLKFCFY